MLKKFLSGIGIFTMLSLLTSFPVSNAAGIYLSNLDIQVDGSPVTTFNPANDSALIKFDLLQNADILAYVLNSNSQQVSLLSNFSPTQAGNITYTWYGTVGNTSTGDPLPNGTYTVKVYAYVNGVSKESLIKNIEIGGSSSLTITNLSLSDTSLDPSPSGDDEDLTISYSLNEAADNLSVVITDSNNKEIKNFAGVLGAKQSGSFVWDGKYSSYLADPGTYKVTLYANKSGENQISQSKSFNVTYNHSNKPNIQNFTISPTSFDPDFDDTVISFINDVSSNITVEIQDSSGNEIRDFDNYEHDDYGSDVDHSITWDGQNNSSNVVSLGTYKAYVRAENSYGVDMERLSVTVDNSGGTIPYTNAHIKDITFNPSSSFEPAEDDELTIKFDIKEDLDLLEVFAVRGGEKIELYSEEDVEEQDNLEVYWDGTDDDDDYVEPGSWKILIESKVDSTELQAARSIDVDYEKPNIDYIYLSKNKFDNELDEFTNIIFRLDSDAMVTIVVLEDGSEDDEIIEDMEVEKDQWYAVEWDGGSYDYTDDLDIKLIAANKVNEDVSNYKKISINLAEDETSTRISNVTMDNISPVITDGNEIMALYYDLEDDADVTISIHKGSTSSGTKVIELLDIENQDAGGHTILWDGRDDDGDKLAYGVYTYKIVSTKSGTDTETGLFVVGRVGDIDSSSGTSSTSTSSDGKVSPNVISIDGVDVSSGIGSFTGDCGGFYDVSSNYIYCDAIAWAKSEGIFIGYSDGTFKPYQAINRVEFLKVVLEALNISILPDDYTDQGFIDVQTGAWYMPYIRTGKMLGIFHGDLGLNTARPADTVNRVESLKLAFEALRVADGYQISTCASSYPDVLFGEWFYIYTCESKKYNLFDGTYLYPANLSTRGEIAELLYRLHNEGLL